MICSKLTNLIKFYDKSIYSSFGKHFSVCPAFGNGLSIWGNYVMECLENSSILHVLLLVYLRFCIIKNPMTKVVPIRYRKVLLILTWILPIITKLPLLFIGDDLHLRVILAFIILQLLIFSVPCVLLIIGLYGKMILTIRKKKQEHREVLDLCKTSTEKRSGDKTTRIISILVMVVCICYVPLIIQRTIYYVYRLATVNEIAISGTLCWKEIDYDNTAVSIN